MMRQGICVVGTVEGDEEKATATARAEIDARLGERERESVHNPTRGQLMPWSTLMPYALVALMGIAVLIASYRIGV